MYVEPVTLAIGVNAIDIALHPRSSGGYSASMPSQTAAPTFLRLSGISSIDARAVVHGVREMSLMQSKTLLARRCSELAALAFFVALIVGVVSLFPGVNFDFGLYGSLALLVAGAAGYVATSRQSS